MSTFSNSCKRIQTLVPLQVHASSIDPYCVDRSAEWVHARQKLCGTRAARDSLLYGTPEIAEQVRLARYHFSSVQASGILAVQPKWGFSGVQIPSEFGEHLHMRGVWAILELTFGVVAMSCIFWGWSTTSFGSIF